MGFAHSSILGDAHPSRYLRGGMPFGPEIAEALDLAAGPVHQNITPLFRARAVNRFPARKRGPDFCGARRFLMIVPALIASASRSQASSNASQCCNVVATLASNRKPASTIPS